MIRLALEFIAVFSLFQTSLSDLIHTQVVCCSKFFQCSRRDKFLDFPSWRSNARHLDVPAVGRGASTVGGWEGRTDQGWHTARLYTVMITVARRSTRTPARCATSWNVRHNARQWRVCRFTSEFLTYSNHYRTQLLMVSGNDNRTTSSAQAVLEGMFPYYYRSDANGEPIAPRLPMHIDSTTDQVRYRILKSCNPESRSPPACSTWRIVPYSSPNCTKIRSTWQCKSAHDQYSTTCRTSQV